MTDEPQSQPMEESQPTDGSQQGLTGDPIPVTNPYETSHYPPNPYAQPWGSYGTPTSQAPSKHPLARRGIAVAVASTLAVAVVGGSGFVIGRFSSHGDSATAAGSASTLGGSTSSGGGFELTLPGGGTLIDPYSGGNGMTDPWFQGGPGGTSSSRSAPSATSDQRTGMVRIASRLLDGRAAGTGMILTSNGEVVTNNHVVEGSTRLRVKDMSTGTWYRARVVGTDATDDVAVIKLIGAHALSTVTLATSAATKGDKITAIGDAGGLAGRLSAVDGTVLATGRAITTQSENGDTSEHLHKMIVLDADVMSGDSGGATVNSSGEVVGMTTAASAASTNVRGFAIPIAKVMRLVGAIRSGVETERIQIGYDPFLGVELVRSTSAATIAGVIDGSAAAKAGISTGSTVTALGDTKVSTGSALRAAIADYKVGDSVTVTWTDTAGTSHTATVTLMRAPVA